MSGEVLRFGQLMSEGMAKISAACDLYFDVCAREPRMAVEFSESFPQIPQATWDKFYKIGSKQLHKGLLNCSDIVVKQVSHLSYFDQNRLLVEGVDYVTSNGVEKGTLSEIPPAKLKQIISTTGQIRDVQGQRTFIGIKSNKDKPKYYVEGEKVYFNKCMLTLSELKNLVNNNVV